MLSKVVAGVDKIPEYLLFLINIVISIFVIMAHGGYLILVYVSDKEPVSATCILLFLSVSVSVLILMTSFVALVSRRSRKKILCFQATAFFMGSFYFFFTTSVSLVSILSEESLVWSPGLFTFFCVYSVYLMRRLVFIKWLQTRWIIKYAHILMLIISLGLDLMMWAKVENSSAKKWLPLPGPNEESVMRLNELHK